MDVIRHYIPADAAPGFDNFIDFSDSHREFMRDALQSVVGCERSRPGPE